MVNFADPLTKNYIINIFIYSYSNVFFKIFRTINSNYNIFLATSASISTFKESLALLTVKVDEFVVGTITF